MSRRIAALCIALASPAAAETYAQGKRMTLLPGAGHCFAVVSIENTVGNYNDTETLETAYGPVSLSYRTVGGHNPNDHDIVEVVSVPDGVAAFPPLMDLPDGDTGEVCLSVNLGS